MDNLDDIKQLELEDELARIKAELAIKNYSNQDWINFCAILIMNEANQDKHIEGLKKINEDHEKLWQVLSPKMKEWQRQGVDFYTTVCKYQKAVIGYKKSIPSLIRQGITADKSNRAKAAAALRHLSTFKLKDEIIAFWRKEIGVNVTNELAAEQLQKKFPDVSHRTLTRYVSEAKKLQSASTL